MFAFWKFNDEMTSPNPIIPFCFCFFALPSFSAASRSSDILFEDQRRLKRNKVDETIKEQKSARRMYKKEGKNKKQ